MASNGRIVWQVQAGSDDQAYDIFLRKGDECVAIGWPLGDMALLGTREDFKDKVEQVYRKERWPKNRVANIAGQNYRFVYEMEEDQAVVYPSKDGYVHIGLIKGHYEYDPAPRNRGYEHKRRVDWRKHVRKEYLPMNLRSLLGGRLTVQQIKDGEEFYKL